MSATERAASDRSRLALFLAAALLVALVLVPVAIIRRPRTVGEPISAGVDEGADTRVLAPETAPHENDSKVGDAGAWPPPPLLSEIAVQLCSDAAPRRGAVPCDRPAGLEDALRTAARESASCAPKGAGGALPVVVDVSFLKKRPSAVVALGKDGRTLKSVKGAQKCAERLHERIEANLVAVTAHAHARYKLAFVVTYPDAPE